MQAVSVARPQQPAVPAITAATLARAVATVQAFDCRFPAIGWSGQDVLWLAPRPAGDSRTDLNGLACQPYWRSCGQIWLHGWRGPVHRYTWPPHSWLCRPYGLDSAATARTLVKNCPR